MQFGERLAYERKRLGYRGADFARECGVTPASQSLYENGKRKPDSDYLRAACLLGADPAFLLIGAPSHPSTLQVREEDRGPLAEFHGLTPKARKAMMALVAAVREQG